MREKSGKSVVWWFSRVDLLVSWLLTIFNQPQVAAALDAEQLSDINAESRWVEWVFTYTFKYLYVGSYVFMYVCIYMHIYIYKYLCTVGAGAARIKPAESRCVECVFAYDYVYMYAYLCMYIYICIYICICVCTMDIVEWYWRWKQVCWVCV